MDPNFIECSELTKMSSHRSPVTSKRDGKEDVNLVAEKL